MSILSLNILIYDSRKTFDGCLISSLQTNVANEIHHSLILYHFNIIYIYEETNLIDTCLV